MLGQKISLSKFKNIEIVSSIFFDHNAMNLQTNRKKNTEKIHKDMEAKQHAIKQWMGQQQSKGRNQKIPWNKWNKETPIQICVTLGKET